MGIFGLVATRNAISYPSDYSTYFDHIVYVPLWRFFLDVTKVPNLCPSLPKEGYGGGGDGEIHRTRKREIQSHPSCYPGASGGGSVHPTYGERWPPWLTFVEKHGTPPSLALRSYCYVVLSFFLAYFVPSAFLMTLIPLIGITNSTTHRPIRTPWFLFTHVYAHCALFTIRNGQTYVFSLFLSLSLTLFLLCNVVCFFFSFLP